MSDSKPINPFLLSSLGIEAKQQTDKSRNELGQSEFFELMLTQLQNQDPLNPSDSNEFLAQIAQFSTVDSINKMQNSMAELAASFQSSQALQASTLVGRNVLVDGNSSRFEPGSSLNAAVNIPQATDGLTVNITDAAGQLVRSLDLGLQPGGLTEFTWNGLMDNGETAAAGTYNLTAAIDVDGTTFGAETLIATRIDSVSLGRNGVGMSLNLAGGGTVTVDQIKQLR